MRITRFVARTSLLRARIAAASGFILAIAAAASAAVTPVAPGASNTTVGSGAGMDGAVSPTGGFAASVPLDLPSPRGDVPIPLSVVYTGSGRAGVAGQGWDVPISYVRRSTSIWRRKPFANLPQTPDEAPVGADRVTVSLGGQTHLMQNVGGTWWPARGESFMELKQNGNEWSLKTLDNHEYIFRTGASMGAIGGGSLWLLAEVRDAIGGDKVVLKYATDADRVDRCSPGLALRSLAYTYDANPTTPTPLYEIYLDYEPDWRPRLSEVDERYLPSCATRGDSEAAYPFERIREDGTVLGAARLRRARREQYRSLDQREARSLARQRVGNLAVGIA